MRLCPILCAVAVSLAFPTAALADGIPIKVDPKMPFKHRLSRIEVGPVAAGIPRSEATQYDENQLDVALNFRAPDEITSVYIFRRVTGDVPVWFDRIQRTVEASPLLDSPTVAVPPAAFTPAGQSNARGLRAVYSAKGPWKSSAAALTIAGGWYIAVRASSRTASPEQLLTRIDQTFSAIRLPSEKVPSADAVPISTCTTALAHGEDAKPVDDQDAVALMSAFSASVGKRIASEFKPEAPRWCRDPVILPSASVYRPDGATDRYLIAFQDAGRGVWVTPNGLAGVLAGATNGDPETSYMVELIAIDRHVGYGSFKTLPSVNQSMWLLDHGPRRYESGIWGNEKAINIFTDSSK